MSEGEPDPAVASQGARGSATRGRSALLFAVATVVALALLEFGASLWLPRLEAAAAPGAMGDVAPATGRFEHLYVAQKVLHPYLGFVADPSDPAVNALGFYGADPREVASDDEVVVALFGGSVAMYFREAEDYFRERLEMEGFADAKRVRLIHLGLDGYKQPQQLLLLHYLLTLGVRLDVVLNLDGFNEVALPWTENLRARISLIFPRNWQLFAKKGFSTELAREVATVDQRAERRRRWQERFAAAPLAWSRFARAVGLVLDQRLYGAWQESHTRLEERLAADPGAFHELGPRQEYASGEALFSDLARVWQTTSQQMHDACAARGIAYHHFLQPNQYVPHTKSFSDEERAHAIAGPEFGYRQGVEVGYPELRRAGAALVRAGVSFTDLSGLFETESETIYIDRCCHLNERGNRAMAERIAKVVAAAAVASEGG